MSNMHRGLDGYIDSTSSELVSPYIKVLALGYSRAGHASGETPAPIICMHCDKICKVSYSTFQTTIKICESKNSWRSHKMSSFQGNVAQDKAIWMC